VYQIERNFQHPLTTCLFNQVHVDFRTGDFGLTHSTFVAGMRHGGLTALRWLDAA